MNADYKPYKFVHVFGLIYKNPRFVIRQMLKGDQTTKEIYVNKPL